MYAEFLAAVKAAHNEAYRENSMVCQIWEDGEVTLQKGGSLFGQRTLHCIQIGLPFAVKPEDMPVPRGNHGYAFVASTEEGERLRDILRECFRKNKIGEGEGSALDNE